MRLATYSRDGGAPRVGLVIDDGIVDLSVAVPALPRDMIGLITGGAAVLAELRRVAVSAARVPLTAVRLLAPVPQPPEFIGVGLNYHDHAAEAGLAVPSEPMVFNKQCSCIIGPHDEVVLPAVSGQLDYEGELGLVIGRAGRRLSLRQASDAIFGYVVVNDYSVRDWQFKSPTVTLGKSFDTHGPVGPWIVTAESIPNPQSLALMTSLNGAVRQSSNTADMIFSCAAIVAFLSTVMTLRPGTVVTTGTPAGVGVCRQPPTWLKVGDVVAVEIAGIGRLVNRVVEEAAGQ